MTDLAQMIEIATALAESTRRRSEGLTPAELLQRDLAQKMAFDAWQRDLDAWDEPVQRPSLGALMRKEADREG